MRAKGLFWQRVAESRGVPLGHAGENEAENGAGVPAFAGITLADGLMSGTLIATHVGWREVELVRP